MEAFLPNLSIKLARENLLSSRKKKSRSSRKFEISGWYQEKLNTNKYVSFFLGLFHHGWDITNVYINKKQEQRFMLTASPIWAIKSCECKKYILFHAGLYQSSGWQVNNHSLPWTYWTSGKKAISDSGCYILMGKTDNLKTSQAMSSER